MLHHPDLAGRNILEIEHVFAAGPLDAVAVVDLPDVLQRDLGAEIVVAARGGRADIAQHMLMHQRAAELRRLDRAKHGLDPSLERGSGHCNLAMAFFLEFG